METICEDKWLNDTHIDYFGFLLKNCSEYQPRESWRIQCPDTIKPISNDQKHIQILYSCSDIITNKNGHWVCSYYDTRNIYIYDSLNLKRLHVHNKIYLEKLCPFFPFHKKPVLFPTVQLQLNNNDCGVFAIAFAVSLLFGLQPNTVMYDYTLMRQHVAQMFHLNKIEHFPRIIRPNDPKQLFTFDEIQRRQVLAKKKREFRLSQKKQKCNELKLEKDITEVIVQETVKNDKMLNIINSSIYAEKSILTDVSPYETEIQYKRSNFVTDILPLKMHDIHKILKGEWLEDIHIDYFGSLLKSCSQYQPRESLLIQCPDRIKPVAKNQKHIQILYSCSNMVTNLDGHWVCTYYDTKVIYIYDSLNLKRLHTHHKIYLEKLFPFYSFHKQSIQFPTVQKQPNGSDCGVFAIAFAVSLLFGLRPDTIIYDHSLMRQHLAQMFQLNKIEHFPQIVRFTDPRQSSALYQIQETKTLLDEKQEQERNKEELLCDDNIILKGNKTSNIIKCNDTLTVVEYSNYSNLNKAHLTTNISKDNVVKENGKININNSCTIAKKHSECVKSVTSIINENISAQCIDIVKGNNNMDENNYCPYNDIYFSNISLTDIVHKNDIRDVDTDKRGAKRKENFIHPSSNEKRTKKCDIYPEDTLHYERKSIANKKYYKLHRDDLLANKKIYNKTISRKIYNWTYYQLHRDSLLAKRKVCYNKCKNRIQNRLGNKRKEQVVRKIKKKYYHIMFVNNNVKMKYTKDEYIRNISRCLGMPSLSENRLEAERIAKWCFYIRDMYILRMKKIFNKCKTKAEVCLTRAAKCSSSEFMDYVSAFCGQSKHTAFSELYFSESTYHTLNSSESIIMNSEGKAINILPLIKSKNNVKKTWCCGSLCKVEVGIINELKCCFQEFLHCTLKNLHKFLWRIHNCYNRARQNKLGHSQSCYINYKSCRSWFLIIEIVSPHYPSIRYIKRLLYDLINIDKKLNKLDKALEDVDINILRDISTKAQEEAKVFIKSITEINLNENGIRSQYCLAFKAFTRRSIDVPRYVCISCTKYCFERDIIRIKIHKKGSITMWDNFVNNVGLKVNENYIICKYCNRYFKDNKMPPTCRCNKLEVLPVPEEITMLNDYERILIQRAKAFQTVQKMGTVMSKNLPHKHMVSKVKGRTFHLPLPLEETLKKICPSTEPINLNHELYILVRGIPTKANIVWEKLVDVKKVWNVLTWLKHNNPIYTDIVLPISPENLLHSELQNVEFRVEDNCDFDNTDDKILIETTARNNKMRKQEKKALLTQMSQSDQYYEQFTIYPMYERRINESSSTLYQMIKVEDIPLDIHAKDLDIKCFPDLYPYGINGQHEDRSVRITDYEYIKVRLMSQNSQFRLNIQYIFYLLYDSNMRQLNAGIFHKMNVTNPREKYTAATYLEQLSKQQLESNLSTIFSRLRNTEQYWRIPRSSLHCMIYNYGPATWFLTLSPCEWLWTDLIEYLREINESFAVKKSVNELIAFDPVSVSRFIDNKFKAMLDFICSPDEPIGKVTHYFWRREYQGRGMQHFHLLIWIKDAPIIGIASNNDIASFILKYVTCRIPQKKVSPELYRRVDTHQRHKHNNYCMRVKKTKVGFSKVCRFGFPRSITDTLKIRDVAVSIANRRRLKTKSRLYDLPRSQDEVNINDYNPAILVAWEGNMDIQFVGEKSTLLTWYTTKYVSKAEKSNIADISDENMKSTKSLRSCLWNFGMRMLSYRECGALEAADTLLGISLYGTDNETTIRWLDVNIIRNRKLKSRKEIQMLNSDSTDIFCPSIIDTYYPNRPEELEFINLYDYAKWYDIVKTKPCSKKVEYYVIGKSLYLRKRKRGYLINHYKYNVHIQPERYYFSLLLLFKPWRDIDILKNECNSYAEAFFLIQFQLKDALQYHERIIDIQQGMDNIKELIEQKILEDRKNEADNFDNCALECVPIEVEGAMKDFKDVGNKFEDDNVNDMIAQLNTDQKRIFDRVTASIVSNSDILRHYISGEGGTGKSFLIKTIRCWIKKYSRKDVAVTAPTGIAAFNIDGLTIHRLFQLPVEHGHTAKYKQLSDVVLKTIREELRNVILIIVDEVSMISNVTLMYIHLRLTEIFNTMDCDNGWFGKKHILLFGDLLQLPPVHEEPLFIELSKVKIGKYIGAMGSVNLWLLFSYDELQINVRQQNDNFYRDILSRIRVGIVIDSDTAILKTRKIKFIETTCGGRLQELCNYLQNLPADAVCLLPTCALCDTLNTAMLNRISSNEIELFAQDVVDCVPYLKKKVSKVLNKDDEDNSRTAGLARVIIVKLGARIMIRRNIDVSLGLVNGTIGTITSVIRSNDNEVEKIKIMLPSGEEHIIERLSVKFEVMDRAFIIRKQFPICLSYGMTIHKSQGLSLKHAVIEAGNSVFSCGQIYVALSRVTTLNGLHLINYDPSSIKASESAIMEYNRLRKEYRPDLTNIDISKQHARKVCDTLWAISKYVLDCQINDEDVNKHTSWPIRGFLNDDNVSCYANASIQCIFHSSILRRILFQLEDTNVMRKLIEYYGLHTKDLNTIAVRRLAGDKFVKSIQQDASEFITHLIDKLDSIKNMIKHEISITSRCKICNYTNTEIYQNYILLLRLPENIKKTPNLQELIQYNYSGWKNIEKLCVCGGNSMLQKRDIMITNGVLLFQLLLFKESNSKVNKITNFYIKSIPTVKIHVAGNTYKIVSAIFHHGENIIHGHYTNMIYDKGTKWMCINDLEVRKCNWPRNARNAYILFAEKV